MVIKMDKYYTLSDEQINEIEGHLVSIQTILLQVKGYYNKPDDDRLPPCMCGQVPEPHQHCAGCNKPIGAEYEICSDCYGKEHNRVQFIETIETKEVDET